jgi:hypothetical protein
MMTNNQKSRGSDLFTTEEAEQIIVMERLYLYNHLLPCGAVALKRHLHSLEGVPVPSISTIGRILTKHCLTHGRTGYYPGDYRGQRGNLDHCLLNDHRSRGFR